MAAPASADADHGSRLAFDQATLQVGDVCAVPCFDPVCSTRSVAKRRSNWQFVIAPYGWLAGVDGTVVSGGQETDIDIPFDDITEHVNGGFELYLEARWRRWFVAFDGTWADMGGEYGGRFLDLDLEIKQKLFDVRVGYEVFRWELDRHLDPCCEGWRRRLSLDAFVGARYWYTKLSAELSLPIGRPRRVGETTERWDPFVGIRFGGHFTRHWGVEIRADVGAFDIGAAANLTWQVSALVGYRITPWLNVLVGWRTLYADTIEGSGAQRNGEALTQSGPLIGAGFTF